MSVHPSVCDVGDLYCHIGWVTSKVITLILWSYMYVKVLYSVLEATNIGNLVYSRGGCFSRKPSPRGTQVAYTTQQGWGTAPAETNLAQLALPHWGGVGVIPPLPG